MVVRRFVGWKGPGFGWGLFVFRDKDCGEKRGKGEKGQRQERMQSPFGDDNQRGNGHGSGDGGANVKGKFLSKQQMELF